MKITRSKKLIFLSMILVLSFTLAFVFIAFNNNKIVSADTAKTYTLAIDDLEIGLNGRTEDFTMTFSADSFNAYGNKQTDKEIYDTTIEYKLVVNPSTNKATLNGVETEFTATAEEKPLIIKVNVVDNIIKIKINDTEIANITEGLDYYKIKNYCFPTASVTFSYTPSNSNDYIDQKASYTEGEGESLTHPYRQVINGSTALPRVKLADYIYENGVNESKKYYNVRTGLNYDFSSSSTGLIQYYVSSSKTLKISCEEANINEKQISFPKEDDYEITVSANDTVLEDKIYLHAVKDEVAPVYYGDDNAVANYKKALEYALYEKNDDGSIKTDEKGNKVYISVGSDKYLTLPSMKSFVSDKVTGYSKLTYTIYYKNKCSTSFSTYTSAFKVPVTEVGDYLFYVVFKDQAGNEMNKTDIYNYDEKTGEETKSAYVFSFTILENNDTTIKVPKTNYIGYVDVAITGSSFVIPDSCTESYALYYSSNNIAESAEGWTDITSDSNYSFSETTFTPKKTGYYKVACTVTATSGTTNTKSYIVTVNGGQTVVQPETTSWAQNNVWSIVFLSIGGACLIAIIILLFIKPKDKTKETRTVKGPNKEDKE